MNRCGIKFTRAQRFSSRSHCVHFIAIVVLAAVGVPPRANGDDRIASDGRLPRFEGQAVCRECHGDGARARACTLRVESPDPHNAAREKRAPCRAVPAVDESSHLFGHDAAFGALCRPEARNIAALCGVATESPMTSRFCLGCHSTGADEGPRWHNSGFRIEDGVQCEACHGPGSLHVARQRASAPSHSEPLPIDPALDVRRGDRATCSVCHRSLDSHREVLERGFRLAAEDGRYLTPVNVAVIPDGRLLVACEGSNSIAVVEADGRVAAQIRVGHRACDIAVAPDGRYAYVSNRLGGTVSVIDLVSLVVTNEFSVGAEPHGLHLDSAGEVLYVCNTGQDTISVIQASSGRESQRIVAGRGPWSIARSNDGRHAAITSVRPDPVPFREPPQSELTVLNLETKRVARRVTIPEANMLHGIVAIPGRREFLFTLVRTKNLVPMTRLQQGWVMTHGLGVLRDDGRVDQVLLDEPNRAFPDPTGVAVSPDGRIALVTSGGADEVAVIDVSALLSLLDSSSVDDRRELLPNHLGYASRFVVHRLRVGGNPRGVVFSPDGLRAFVANALDDSISVINTSSWTVAQTWSLGGPTDITVIRRGQRLFHSAAKTFGRQFSCASCHPDGHMDGLTFDIEADGLGLHPADNRTLRGIFDTAPFKWEGTNPSLHRQCGPRLAVFFTRLEPFTPEDLKALVWYESTIELPPNPNRSADGLSPSQYRGRLVFQRAHDNAGREIPLAQRCSFCHDSPYFTNRAVVPQRNVLWFDFPVELDRFELFNDDEFGDLGALYYLESGAHLNHLDVPHLTNIYQGGPYLHNGAARTLEEIWTRFNPTEDHGRAVDLTRRQFNDLIAYLKAL